MMPLWRRRREKASTYLDLLLNAVSVSRRLDLSTGCVYGTGDGIFTSSYSPQKVLCLRGVYDETILSVIFSLLKCSEVHKDVFILFSLFRDADLYSMNKTKLLERRTRYVSEVVSVLSAKVYGGEFIVFDGSVSSERSVLYRCPSRWLFYSNAEVGERVSGVLIFFSRV